MNVQSLDFLKTYPFTSISYTDGSNNYCDTKIRYLVHFWIILLIFWSISSSINLSFLHSMQFSDISFERECPCRMEFIPQCFKPFNECGQLYCLQKGWTSLWVGCVLTPKFLVFHHTSSTVSWQFIPTNSLLLLYRTPQLPTPWSCSYCRIHWLRHFPFCMAIFMYMFSDTHCSFICKEPLISTSSIWPSTVQRTSC